MSRLLDAVRNLPDAVFVDVLESDDGYRIVADLPGVNADTLDVVVTDDQLHVEAHREKSTRAGYEYLREDRPLLADLELPLPLDADPDGVSCRLDRGVLEIELQKHGLEDVTEIPIADS